MRKIRKRNVFGNPRKGECGEKCQILLSKIGLTFRARSLLITLVNEFNGSGENGCRRLRTLSVVKRSK